MKTTQQLHNQMQQVAAFIQLLLIEHKKEHLSHETLCYMLVLLLLGKLPCKNDNRHIYPVLTRISLSASPATWDIAADKIKRQFQLCLPLSKVTDDHIECILPTLIVYLIDKVEFPLHKRPIFSRSSIDEAFAWLSRYAPSRFAHLYAVGHLTDIQALNQTLLDFMKHHVRFNTTYQACRHGSLSMDEATGHAGHVYESITVTDLQDDIAQTLERYCIEVLETHRIFDEHNQSRHSAFFAFATDKYTTSSCQIMRKHSEQHCLFSEVTQNTRKPKFLQPHELQPLLDVIRQVDAKTDDFNTLSTKCLLVFLLLTTTRPQHRISAYKSLNLHEKIMYVTEKKEPRFIYLHPRLSELIESYLDCKTRLATKLSLKLSTHVVFEQIEDQAFIPFIARDIQRIYCELGLFQDTNILRHQFNHQLMKFKIPAKYRNFIMGHGTMYDRHMLLPPSIQQALNDLFNHYQLAPVVTALIKHLEALR